MRFRTRPIELDAAHALRYRTCLAAERNPLDLTALNYGPSGSLGIEHLTSVDARYQKRTYAMGLPVSG